MGGKPEEVTSPIPNCPAVEMWELGWMLQQIQLERSSFDSVAPLTPEILSSSLGEHIITPFSIVMAAT